MSNADVALQAFKRKGILAYDWLRDSLHVKNPPDVVYKLRTKGWRIESIWQEKNGKKHVTAYRYYPND